MFKEKNMPKDQEKNISPEEERSEYSEESEEKKEGFWKKARKVLKNKEIQKQLGKSLAGAGASIYGIKSFYDVPAWLKQKLGIKKSKEEYKELFSNLEKEGVNIEEEQEKEEGERKKVGEIVDLSQIENFEKKIDNLDVSEEIKDKLTEELNSLVENYYQEAGSLKQKENKKIIRTLNKYLKTKISGIQAAKEAANTACVFSGSYALRGIVYGGASVAERHKKLKEEGTEEEKKISFARRNIAWDEESEEYEAQAGDKKELQEAQAKVESGESRISFVRDTVLKGIKETWRDLKLEKEGGKKEKGLAFAKAAGSTLRFLGISGSMVSGSFQENIDTVLDKLSDVVGPAEVSAGETSSGNGWVTLKTKNFGGPGVDEGVRSSGSNLEAAIEENGSAQGENTGKEEGETDSKTTKKPPEIPKEAVIQEGEGIEHAFIRQLKADPGKFGFDGDPDDTEAVNKWAGQQAHRIALDSGYVDADTGQEVRVGGEGKGKVAYVLETEDKGNIKVRENFSEQEEELHEAGSKFETAQDQEDYEYSYKGEKEPEFSKPEDLAEQEIKGTSPLEEIIEGDVNISTQQLDDLDIEIDSENKDLINYLNDNPEFLEEESIKTCLEAQENISAEEAPSTSQSYSKAMNILPGFDSRDLKNPELAGKIKDLCSLTGGDPKYVARKILTISQNVGATPEKVLDNFEQLAIFPSEQREAVFNLLEGNNEEKSLANIFDVSVTEDKYSHQDGLYKVENAKEGVDLYLKKGENSLKFVFLDTKKEAPNTEEMQDLNPENIDRAQEQFGGNTPESGQEADERQLIEGQKLESNSKAFPDLTVSEVKEDGSLIVETENNKTLELEPIQGKDGIYEYNIPGKGGSDLPEGALKIEGGKVEHEYNYPRLDKYIKKNYQFFNPSLQEKIDNTNFADRHYDFYQEVNQAFVNLDRLEISTLENGNKEITLIDIDKGEKVTKEFSLPEGFKMNDLGGNYIMVYDSNSSDVFLQSGLYLNDKKEIVIDSSLRGETLEEKLQDLSSGSEEGAGGASQASEESVSDERDSGVSADKEGETEKAQEQSDHISNKGQEGIQVEDVEFEYDDNGNPEHVKHSLIVNGEPMDLLKKSGEGSNLAPDALDYYHDDHFSTQRLSQVLEYQTVLNKLQEEGQTETEEYKWTLQKIKDYVDEVEKHYGDVFNKDELKIPESEKE